MMREVGPQRHGPFEMHHQAAGEQQPQAKRRHGDARDGGAHGGALCAVGGDRPRTANEHHVQHEVQDRHRDAEAQWRPRIAGGAQCASKHEEHQQPDAVEEHRLQERKRLGTNRRRGIHEVEQAGREQVANRRENTEREREGGQERLIHGAVHPLVIVGARRRATPARPYP